MLFSRTVRIRIRIRIRFSVWLVSGYAHVFVLLSVVIVTLPSYPRRFRETSRDFMSCMKAHTCEFVEIRCNMAASKRFFSRMMIDI